MRAKNPRLALAAVIQGEVELILSNDEIPQTERRASSASVLSEVEQVTARLQGER